MAQILIPGLDHQLVRQADGFVVYEQSSGWVTPRRKGKRVESVASTVQTVEQFVVFDGAIHGA
jgi:hypothetical protein